MKKKAGKILKFLLIALFVSYYCESTLFFHTHIFDWGTVTHSHPYLPNGSHSHTATACQIISLLNNLLFIGTTAVVVLIVMRIITMHHAPRLYMVARHLVKSYSLRAPPYSICSIESY